MLILSRSICACVQTSTVFGCEFTIPTSLCRMTRLSNAFESYVMAWWRWCLTLKLHRVPLGLRYVAYLVGVDSSDNTIEQHMFGWSQYWISNGITEARLEDGAIRIAVPVFNAETCVLLAHVTKNHNSLGTACQWASKRSQLYPKRILSRLTASNAPDDDLPLYRTPNSMFVVSFAFSKIKLHCHDSAWDRWWRWCTLDMHLSA